MARLNLIQMGGAADVDSFLPLSGGTLTGALLFSADNTYAIGAAGATRPSIVYAGTSMIAPIFNAATGFQIGGAAASGHFLVGNGTNYVDATALPSGTVTWDQIGNAGAALTLANAGYATTFNQTSAVNWTWANTTAATTTLINIAPGLGATNVNSVASGSMTLNINIGDCVIIYISGSVVGSSSTLSDNGASGGNTYTRIPALDASDYGFNSAYYCLSATKTATTITVTGGTRYWTQGATFTGVAAIGASHLTQTTSAGSPASDAVTTTANDSLVIAGGNVDGTAFTATSGSVVASSGSGAQFLLTQTVVTSGTVATSSGTYTGAGKQWQIASIELKVAAATFASHSSPILNIDGTYYNGSASAVDSWTIQDIISNAQNGTSTLTFAHSGSSGQATIALPSAAELAWSTDTGISRLGAASLAVGNGTANDFSGSLKLTTLTLQGKIGTYNGVATVNQGVAPILAAPARLTSQTAAQSAVSIVASALAGMYRISYCASITTASDISSTLGGTTGFAVTFTDPQDSVAKTSNPTTPTISAANTTGTTVSGNFYAYAKVGTAITFNFGYTDSHTSTAMAYNIQVMAEYLG